VDALALAGTYTDSALITKQARGIGFTKPIVGGTGLYSPKFIEDRRRGCRRGLFSGGLRDHNPDPAVQEFVRKYKEKYRDGAGHFCRSRLRSRVCVKSRHGKAAEKGSITRDKVRDAMAATRYKGITGTVTFDEKGDWVRPYLYITVKDGKFIWRSKDMTKGGRRLGS